MLPTYESDNVKLYHADCLDVLAEMGENSVDAIVTDPPYGLSNHRQKDVVACLTAWLNGEPFTKKGGGFMGREWDSWVPGPEIWRECLRVIKPGGHLLCFAGRRSVDLMGIALRLAGWELRDMVVWCYGQGYPGGNRNVSKAIDKEAGAEREKGNLYVRPDGTTRPNAKNWQRGMGYHGNPPTEARNTLPSTDPAKQWDGWGSALKPALEPILLCRKPLSERTIAQNVVRWGTGGLNIDACRVEGSKRHPGNYICHDNAVCLSLGKRDRSKFDTTKGRFPPNLLLDGSEEVAALFPANTGGRWGKHNGQHPNSIFFGDGIEQQDDIRSRCERFIGDSGSAARFYPHLDYDDDDLEEIQRLFYCPKAAKRDRNQGCENLAKGNNWPTVKPTPLLQWLIRLITPPGGIVLDPFLGSGSTLKAAIREGFSGIGIEIDEEAFAIAELRVIDALKKRGQRLPGF